MCILCFLVYQITTIISSNNRSYSKLHDAMLFVETLVLPLRGRLTNVVLVILWAFWKIFRRRFWRKKFSSFSKFFFIFYSCLQTQIRDRCRLSITTIGYIHRYFYFTFSVKKLRAQITAYVSVRLITPNKYSR